MAWPLLAVIPFYRLLRVEVTSPCFLATTATQGALENFKSVITASVAAHVIEIYRARGVCAHGGADVYARCVPRAVPLEAEARRGAY